jgi:regulator of sigma E protease
MLLTIVSFAFVFTVITLVHEFGHLCFAKLNGIAVPEFGIGFGPTIYQFSRNETTYKLCLLPILGYVKIAGLDADDEDEKNIPDDKKFQFKPVWLKFSPILSGALLNILLGALVFSVVFMFSGVPAGTSNELAAISPGSEAAKVGLKAGDKLLAINGKLYDKAEEAVDFIHKNPNKQLSLTIERSGKKLAIKATPTLNAKQKIGLIGFQLKAIYRPVGPIQAVYHGFTETGKLCLVILTIFVQLVTGRLSLFDLAGPVGIAQVTGQYAQHGFLSLLNFLAFFSINVGVLNLLPLPALDGGRVVFLLIEAIRGKPIDLKRENQFHAVGMVLLLTLMAVLTVNDVFRLFR